MAQAQLLHLLARDVFAVRFLDLDFDRHAMAVPAGNIGHIEAGQRLRTDDDVLENLVHRMPDVDVAVGIRWAVVQDELGPTGTEGADLLVELFFLPGGDPLRLPFGQITPHREGGVGKIQSVFVVSHGQKNQ